MDIPSLVGLVELHEASGFQTPGKCNECQSRTTEDDSPTSTASTGVTSIPRPGEPRPDLGSERTQVHGTSQRVLT